MNNILFTFERFPLSVCTQEGALNKNKEVLIPATIEEDKNGLISFLPYVDPKLIYLSQHNNSIGETWRQHNDEFANYVYQKEKHKVIDIGGGTGNIFKSYIKYNPVIKWKIIDLNPTETDSRVENIKDLYNPQYINENDTVITSHFLEHLVDLPNFLIGLRKQNPKYHIFTLPNFKFYAKNNYSATIMFEHPHYLTEEYLNSILAHTGWKVIDKKYFKDHSIFFTTIPSEEIHTDIKLDCSQDIISFLDYMKNRAFEIKNKKFYVFGAHFTYYYLLNMGIEEDQIIAVVDNDLKKQNKRMYGTNTKIIPPDELPMEAEVFVEMGPYNDEIKKGLKNVIFI